MDETYFGPWGTNPPKNKWEEYKIGKLDVWYQVSANSLKPEMKDSKSNDEISKGTTLSITTKSSNKSASSLRSQEVEPESIVIQLKKQPRFDIRENWDDPRSFDTFISSPQYMLLGWPTKPISLCDSIGAVKDASSPKVPAGKSTKQRPSRIPMKR